MKRIAHPKLTLDGYGSLFPGTSVSSCKAECSVEGQLCGLVEAALIAVRAKTMDPVEVDDDRARRHMVPSPQPNHLSFAIIVAQGIGRHATLDESACRSFKKLSGESHS